jgi:hypothetical protein
MRQLYAILSIVCFFLLLVNPSFAQEVRSIDGSGNNLTNPEWGAAGSQFLRLTPVGYNDQVSSLAGPNRPNPRVVSNTLFSQDGILNDPLNLSDYTWVWGQFIDHDITFSIDNPNELIQILVPQGDPWFDPFGTGNSIIAMNRSATAPGTGSGVNNPRQHTNAITSFVDASAVYGSSLARASWLRTFVDGKMKTSAGNMLPYNTVTGEKADPIDPIAPHMDDAVGMSPKLFVAGDARANENPLLLSFHTLFVREHNRLCDELVIEHPDWTDEELYQHARRMVSGYIQSTVFDEWLPAMGVPLLEYSGYDPSVNPGISNVFSAAAFRLGHTLLNSNIMRLDNEGNVLPEGNLTLLQAFFNPSAVENGIGIDPYFKGMGVQVQQRMDGKVIDDVRNFLFGPPGAGGLDLASINITRGRERGIPDLNTVRQAVGLPVFQNFFELSNDPVVASVMQALYGDINDIDPWVGMLVETPMPNALFGETIMEIMKQQFTDLRDGDRFYFENDPGLSAAEVQLIKDAKLVDIIRRNTQISIMQDNVFEAMPHEMICLTQDPDSDVSGAILTEQGTEVPGVMMELFAEDFSVLLGSNETATAGDYLFEEIPTCETYIVRPYRNDDADIGVTTLDLVVLRSHILQTQPLTTAYKLIAADANNSGSISTSDMVEIRKVILNITDSYQNNTSWRFVESSYEFQDPLNPFNEDFPEYTTVMNLSDPVLADFVAIKVGDLNDSVDPEMNGEVEDRTNVEPLVFVAEDATLEAGEAYDVTFSAPDLAKYQAYQFTMNYEESELELVGLEAIDLDEFSADNYYVMPEAGAITMSWDGNTDNWEAAGQVFNVRFVAKRSGKQLSDLMQMNSRYTKAEAYSVDGRTTGVSLQFGNSSTDRVALYQNTPNPATDHTVIPFYLPQPKSVRLSLVDATGKEVWTYEGELTTGMHQIDLTPAGLSSGVYYYHLDTNDGRWSRKLVLAK